jgi:hypothetical protein
MTHDTAGASLSTLLGVKIPVPGIGNLTDSMSETIPDRPALHRIEALIQYVASSTQENCEPNPIIRLS